jgi:hypothetical protein
MTNKTAQKAISIRWATSATDIASATIETSIQKPAPARPSLLSWRTKFTVANCQWNRDRDSMSLRHFSTVVTLVGFVAGCVR